MREIISIISLSQFSRSVVSDSATTRTAARQTSLSITNSKILFKLMSIESVVPSNHLILCCPLLLLPWILPSIRVFSKESVLHISPSNEYSELISFKIDGLWPPSTPRDFQESSPTPQFKSNNSLVLSFLYGPTLTSIHDYWKNHSFD